MPDPIFDQPRLADVYDDLDGDRSNLDVYLSIIDELGARSVADIGCGTGTLACRLAGNGIDVVGVDPAAAMLDVAQRKEGAHKVRWVYGTATDLRQVGIDLAVMTGNVAQVFLEDSEWAETLRAVHRVLHPGGHFVFESRRPEREGWLEWNRKQSFTSIDISSVGQVQSWYEVTAVWLPFVTFRKTVVFLADGTELTSDSTLRFRTSNELGDSLQEEGFRVVDVRDAPDRSGKEFVFISVRE